jgi:hypothetical protein
MDQALPIAAAKTLDEGTYLKSLTAENVRGF